MAAFQSSFGIVIFIVLAQISSARKCTYKIGDKACNFYDWTWQGAYSNNSYFLNFCNAPPQCSGSVVCRKPLDSKGTFEGIGLKPNNITAATKLAADGSGFSIVFDSGNTCDHGSTKGNKRSEVLILCGKSLGMLEVVEESPCRILFEFYTTQVCKNYKEIKESVCYLYNSKNELFDLSPLILDKGAHNVSFHGLTINVCREITGTSCPAGTSACYGGKDIGQIQSFSNLVLLKDGRLHLKYASSTCSTNITFTCPRDGQAASGPVLELFGNGCHSEIVWTTDYACPVKTAPSKSCSIETRNGKIDLSLLRKERDFYQVNEKEYKYLLNVCSNINRVTCSPTGTKSFAGCQTFGKNSGKSIGDAQHMTLRYMNGKVLLMYGHGEKCSSGILRKTIITFTCVPSAGHGTPKFNHESYCHYFFDWETSVVCQSPKEVEGDCKIITEENVIYDLSPLVQTGTENWVALKSGFENSGDIYINVCGKIRKQTKTKDCPDESSVCLIDKLKKPLSLGRYESAPLLSKDKSSITLTYLKGDVCATHKKSKTIIKFICAPGQISTSPVLLQETVDGCLYIFEWLTAYACPRGLHAGKDCKVNDPKFGVSFDLTPLKNALDIKGKDYFVVKTREYDFQLKVCEGSKQTSCSTTKLIGGCQHKPSTNKSIVMGYANSDLMYYDGMLNLTYRQGQKCRDGSIRQVHMTFFCNHKAGVGKPQYEKEVSCGQYNFIWFTKYACVPKVVQCVAYDSKRKLLYDLSGFSSRTSWQTTSGSQRFYINICRPLYERPVTCSTFSAACAMKSVTGGGTTTQNLGEVSKPPTVTENGDIVLTYVGGDSCEGGKNISTVIRFICRKDAKQGRPEFDKEKSSACLYAFRWETSFACSSTTAGKPSCTYRDPNLDFTFDLSPLKKSLPFYSVTNSKQDQFILNICGNVNGSKCGKLDGSEQVASCLIDPKKGNPAIGTFSNGLEMTGGQLVLKYLYGERSDTGYEYQTIIRFSCNRSIPLGQPIFDSKIEYTYTFNFPTSLACQPKAVECKVTGEDKNVYSLEPLEKEKGYWTAVNWQLDERKHHYVLGVCQPIVNPPLGCRGKSYGACQLVHDRLQDRGHNMGYVQSQPTAAANAISIRYFNGETCHKKYNRTTRIFFHCSKFQGSPVFQLETRECEYVFNWLTPSACPQLDQTGKNCKVMDPLYQHLFDLNPLHGKVYTVAHGDVKVSLAVCSKDQSNSVPSIQQGSQSRSIGEFNTDLLLVNGDLTVQYTKDDIKTVIKFICDKGAGIAGKGPVWADSTKSFTMTTKYFEFEWRTVLACRSQYELECSVLNLNGKDHLQYDISPLARWDDNWRALMQHDKSDTSEKEIYINVCRRLVRNKATEKCPLNSGLCVKQGDKVVSYGVMEKSPRVVGSSVTLEYTNGDICTTSPEKRYHAKVTLIYDATQKGVGEPFLIDSSKCQKTFMWNSAVAHPVNLFKEEQVYDCHATNPLTGFVFDINPLRGTADYRIETKGQKYIVLNVCGQLVTEKAVKRCGQHSGVCVLQERDDSFHINAGVKDNMLRYDKTLYFDYRGGDKCAWSGASRRSVITFVCAHDVDTGKPELLSTLDECTLFFIWRTKHACETEVQCTAFAANKDYSLRSLKKADGNYKASVGSGVTDDGSEFYINVCRNLYPMKSKRCPPGIAACSIKGDKIKNLGQVTAAPKYQADRSITLLYENGDACEGKPSVKTSTRIVFRCGKSTVNPVLTSIDDNCVYTFEWETRLACTTEDKEKQDRKKCKLIDQSDHRSYDLEMLKRTKSSAKRDYKVTSEQSSSRAFFMNVCSLTSVTNKNCSEAAVCMETKVNGIFFYQNIGSLHQTNILYDRQMGRLTVKYGQDEGSSLPRSKIMFNCQPLVFPGAPQVESENEKEFVFLWSTAAACAQEEPSCTFNWRGKTISLSGMRGSSAYTVQDDHWKYWLNICSGVSNYEVGCPSTAAICRQPLGGGTTEIVSSTLSQNIEVSNTKDYIKVFFKDKALLCAGKSLYAEIRISCDESDSKKLNVDFDQDKCQLIFHMKSKVACYLRESNIDINKKSTQGAKGPSSNGGIIAVVISCVILIFILGLVFRKEERRANFVSAVRFRCKRYLCCRKPENPPFSYNEVHSNDTDDDVSLLSPNDDNDDIENNSNEYHDDIESDEELLRL